MTEDSSQPIDEAAAGVPIEHLPERGRFEARLDGGTAVLEYMRVGDALVFTHTEVPEALEGRGIGSALIRAGLEHVRDHGLKAAPICPFVKAYIRRHPEYRELVVSPRRADRPD